MQLDEIDRHFFMNIKKQTADVAYDLICEKLRLFEMDLLELSDEELQRYRDARVNLGTAMWGKVFTDREIERNAKHSTD
jgi:hypothetical protein